MNDDVVMETSVRFVFAIADTSASNFVIGLNSFRSAMISLEGNYPNIGFALVLPAANDADPPIVFSTCESIQTATSEVNSSVLNSQICPVLGKAESLVGEQAVVNGQRRKKVVVLVTDRSFLASSNRKNPEKKTSWSSVFRSPVGRILFRCIRDKVSLIISGDTDQVMKENWRFYHHITRQTGGTFVPLKHLEKFLFEFIQNVNLGEMNLHRMLKRIQDNVQIHQPVLQGSNPIPINHSPSTDDESETLVIGRPDVKRVLFAIY